MIIDYECEWSILILLLHEYNIIYEVEKYAKKKKILKEYDKIANVEYEILCKCIKLFFKWN